MKLSFHESDPVMDIGSEILQRIANGSPYVHVQNLPIINTSELHRSNYIKGIASAMGQLTLSDGIPDTELWALNSITSPNASHIPFHTDNPFLEEPEEIVSFWNIRSSKDSGENTILPILKLVEWLDSSVENAELLTELTTTNVHFTSRSRHSNSTILDPATKTVRYDQKYIHPDHAKLGHRFATLLEGVQPLIDTVKLAEGDALFFNNRMALHGRTAYNDKNRLSIRVRIAPSKL